MEEPTYDYNSIERIIDEAYKLYMPQVKSEITGLASAIDVYFIEPPKVILEIGTKFGGTFYIWNELFRIQCEVSGIAPPLCISIDMSDGGIHGGISDEEMDKRDLWFLERYKNCHFIRGNSHSDATFWRLINYLLPDLTSGRVVSDSMLECVDILFIDGDHSYEGVKQDWEMYYPLLKRDGVVIFHDINDSERHRSRAVYVAKFWNELKASNQYDCVEFNEGQDWAGIGMIYNK